MLFKVQEFSLDTDTLSISFIFLDQNDVFNDSPDIKHFLVFPEISIRYFSQIQQVIN